MKKLLLFIVLSGCMVYKNPASQRGVVETPYKYFDGFKSHPVYIDTLKYNVFYIDRTPTGRPVKIILD